METREQREGREKLMELEAKLPDAERAYAAAEAAERESLIAAARPEDSARLRHLLEAAEAIHGEAMEYQHRREALAARVGLAPGDHPLPMLLAPLGDALTRLRRLVDPAPAASEPVPAGRVRLRLTARVSDRERCGQMFLPGDQADFAASVATDLVKRGLAVEGHA